MQAKRKINKTSKKIKLRDRMDEQSDKMTSRQAKKLTIRLTRKQTQS